VFVWNKLPAEQANEQTQNELVTLVAAALGRRCEVFVLPERGDALVQPQLRYELCVKRLARHLFACQRTSTMSEREWLRAAQQQWERVRHSTALADYSEMLQEYGF
jgi:hypothetical protein